MSWRGKFFNRKLVGLAKFRLKFETLTGLLIQMPVSAQAYRIGGADRYPMTTKRKYTLTHSSSGERIVELEVPFVPGSSFKGRMRALLELATGQKLYTTDGRIWAYMRNLSAMKIEEFIEDVKQRNTLSELFGWSAASYRQIHDEIHRVRGESGASGEVDNLFQLLSPTRLLVSDFYPSESYVERHSIMTLADFLEEKPENRIDRVTSAADPREIVRVRPGVEFEGYVTMLLFDHDAEKLQDYMDKLLLGFKLIEETYIGSSGSRGYGRIKFVGESVSLFKVRLSQNSSEVLEKIDEVKFSSLEVLKSKVGEIVERLRGLYEEKV